MTDTETLEQRVEAILTDDYCNADHETYEGCATCEYHMAGLIADQAKRIAELETAINKTLDDNGHLADGDNCTLIDLKRVVNSEI